MIELEELEEKKNIFVTTIKTRVEESGTVQTENVGIVKATRERCQGRLTRNVVRSLGI